MNSFGISDAASTHMGSSGSKSRWSHNASATGAAILTDAAKERNVTALPTSAEARATGVLTAIVKMGKVNGAEPKGKRRG